MSNSRFLMICIGVPVIVLTLGIGLLAWPAYHATSATEAEIDNLQLRITEMDLRSEQVEELTEVLEERQRHIREELKEIPESPDQAMLIGRLSMPIDGTTVVDQSFTAGKPVSALPGDDSPMSAMPVTVEMEAQFDSVFALIQAAESMRRLVRVSSVHLMCKRQPQMESSSSRLISASLGLEAIYLTPELEEGR